MGIKTQEPQTPEISNSFMCGLHNICVHTHAWGGQRSTLSVYFCFSPPFIETEFLINRESTNLAILPVQHAPGILPVSTP